MRHLELRLEVTHGAQATDDEAGTDANGEVDRQTIEAGDVDALRDVGQLLGDRLADDGDAIVERGHGRLARVGQDTHGEAVEDGRGTADDVEMAERDRVEGAGVDRRRHGSRV